MELHFERGQADAPAGHALVYFQNTADRTTLATYIVVLPIALQLAKYIPPMLAAQLPTFDLGSTGAIPIPPIPEPVESLAYLGRIAELRRDDLIAAGPLNPGDVGRAMAVVSEVAQQYARMYESGLKRLPTTATEATESGDELSASDAIYGLMSEQQKLGELAKLAGQLRYAVDGADRRQISDLTVEMTRLARFLPPTYRVAEFIVAATRPGTAGRELAALYLDRCYKLGAEDYSSLAGIDREIERLRGEP